MLGIRLFMAGSGKDRVVIMRGDPMSPGSFLAPVTLPEPVSTGNTDPVAVVVMDLDGATGPGGEHYPDLVVALKQVDALQVYLNPGDVVTRLPLMNLPVAPRSLTVADFDGDGQDDLAVGLGGGAANQDRLAVFYGTGTGTLMEDSQSPFDTIDRTVTGIGVLSYDGGPGGPRNDIVVACDLMNTVRFLVWDDTAGGFDETTLEFGEIISLDADPTDLVVADVFLSVQGDEILVATTGNPDTLGVTLLKRSTFPGPFDSEEIEVGGDCTALGIGDFVADPFDRIDLVVAHASNPALPENSSVLTVLSNSGSSFDTGSALRFHTAYEPLDLTVADFDQANGPDVAVPGSFLLLDALQRPEPAFVSVHLDAGSQAFVSDTVTSVSVTEDALEGAERVALCHIDPASCGGDANLDAVTMATTLRKLLVSRGNGDGTFEYDENNPTMPREIPLDEGRVPLDLAVGDVDGDGDCDMITIDAGTGAAPQVGAGLTFVRNRFCETGLIKFFATALPAHPSDPDRYLPQSVLLHDFTRRKLNPNAPAPPDGYLDLVVGLQEPDPTDPDAPPIGYRIQVYVWDPGGCLDEILCTYPHFELVQEISFGSTRNNPIDLAMGDLDGDGIDDLLVALQGRGTGNYPTGEDCDVGINKGGYVILTGTGLATPFSTSFTPQLNLLNVSDPRAVAIADLTPGSGGADIVLTSHCDDTVVIYTGDGSGGFSFLEAHAVGSWPYALDVTDLDGDGSLDLGVACRDSNNLVV